MNKLSIICAAILVLSLSAHAQDRADQGGARPGVVGGTLNLIYVVSGVRDNGGFPNTGTATSFLCSNSSTVSENLRIIVRNEIGTVIADATFVVQSARTHTASTHATAAFNEDEFLSPGTAIAQGMAFIFSTSPLMFCSAMIVDAEAASPVGVALHMVRFNPQAGTQE